MNTQVDLRHFRINIYNKMPNDYWKDFDKCREIYFPVIQQINKILAQYGIIHAWFFFEPYLEFNFIADNCIGQVARWTILNHLDDNIYDRLECNCSIEDRLGKAEWYAKNDKEQHFGVQRYITTANLALLMNDYKEDIQNGHGIDYQVMRSIHSLSNQLGLNYRREGWICLRRSIFCLLAWFASFVPFARRKPVHVAAWICRKLLRQKSMA